MIVVSSQVGATPESSVAFTERLTVTHWPFAGQMLSGVARSETMPGAVVSPGGGGAAAVAVAEAAPAASAGTRAARR